MTYINLLGRFVETTTILSLEQKTSLKRDNLQTFAYNYREAHTYLTISNVAIDFMINVLQINKHIKGQHAELKRCLKHSFTPIIKDMVKDKLIIKHSRKTYKINREQ